MSSVYWSSTWDADPFFSLQGLVLIKIAHNLASLGAGSLVAHLSVLLPSSSIIFITLTTARSPSLPARCNSLHLTISMILPPWGPPPKRRSNRKYNFSISIMLLPFPFPFPLLFKLCFSESARKSE